MDSPREWYRPRPERTLVRRVVGPVRRRAVALVLTVRVLVQVGGVRYQARVELIEDPTQVADFLEVRLKRHPLMVGLMLRAQGLPLKHTHQDLESLAVNVVAVKLIPVA